MQADLEEIKRSARMLGRLGGLARSRKLSPQRRREIARSGATAANARRTRRRRSEIARLAARARWDGRRAARRITENFRRIQMIDYLRANVKFE